MYAYLMISLISEFESLQRQRHEQLKHTQRWTPAGLAAETMTSDPFSPVEGAVTDWLPQTSLGCCLQSHASLHVIIKKETIFLVFAFSSPSDSLVLSPSKY